jgi:hypothetical protein
MSRGCHLGLLEGAVFGHCTGSPAQQDGVSRVRQHEREEGAVFGHCTGSPALSAAQQKGVLLCHVALIREPHYGRICTWQVPSTQLASARHAPAGLTATRVAPAAAALRGHP